MLRGTRAVILKDGKVLLGKRLKRDSFYGLWCTFGGGVEPGESPEQALRRELREELGIEAVDLQLLTTIETTAEDDFPETVSLHYHLLTEWRGEIVNKSEHSEIAWFSLDELKDLPMGWLGKKVIEEHLARPEGTPKIHHK